MRSGGEPHAPEASVPDEHALAGLRFGWGDAYEIGWDPQRRWWARRRDNQGGDITAGTPGELWDAVYADYTAAPVPRVLPAEASR